MTLHRIYNDVESTHRRLARFQNALNALNDELARATGVAIRGYGELIRSLERNGRMGIELTEEFRVAEVELEAALRRVLRENFGPRTPTRRNDGPQEK